MFINKETRDGWFDDERIFFGSVQHNVLKEMFCVTERPAAVRDRETQRERKMKICYGNWGQMMMIIIILWEELKGGLWQFERSATAAATRQHKRRGECWVFVFPMLIIWGWCYSHRDLMYITRRWATINLLLYIWGWSKSKDVLLLPL